MFEEFQAAAEKAEKREKLNNIIFLLAGFIFALAIIIFALQMT